jgi:hypothetical protein
LILTISKRPVVLLFLLSLSCTAGARAAVPVWVLLAEARVASESIYLSDLLPVQAPPEIRNAAEKISLGPAPMPGSTITLAGEKIVEVLPGATRDEIIVPAQVVVHRSARLLTRAEVMTAIRVALHSREFPGGSGIDPESVHFSAPVRISAEDAKLEVRRVDFDAALKQARFLLASAADPRVLPFLVTAELRSTSHENASESFAETVSAYRGLRGFSSDAHSVPVSAKLSGEMPLVEPRKPAKLHVVSGSMQMFLDVVPLERGALHDTVRVRIPGSGKVLRGQVIAPGRLEAQF